jgi:branched-chain amino acid transport system permease protein
MNLIQTAIDAISLGSVYAMAALGVGLIFSIMRLINFAHGELIMAGGFALYVLAGQPVALMMVVAILVAMVLALSMERVAFRTLRQANPATLLISSFALSYLLQHVALLIFGSRAMGLDFLGALNETIEFAGLRVPRLEVATVIVTALLLGLLTLFFKRSPIGIQMRAAAEDFDMARLVGVRADRVIAVAFALSGMLAGFVSLYVVAQGGSVSYKMGVNMVLVAFVASVIGGIGSLPGAALGGFLLGIVSVALQAFLPEAWRPYRDAFVFLLFIAFLLWRPQGLLSRRADRERV